MGTTSVGTTSVGTTSVGTTSVGTTSVGTTSVDTTSQGTPSEDARDVDMNMRDSFVRAVGNTLANNPRTVVVLADIGAGQFHDAGISEAFPGRIINVGIREQTMVGVAAGLSREGFLPIVHSYAPFLIERPYEQLKIDFSHQGLRGIFVSVGASADAAAAGRTHQCPADIGLVGTLPGWTGLVPGHPAEVPELLDQAIVGEGCFYIRLSDGSNHASGNTDSTGWRVIRNGSSTAPLVVAVGPLLDVTTAATADLDVSIVYTVCPTTPDTRKLQNVATGSDVIVVEPYLAGTSTPWLASALADRPRRFLHLGFPGAENRHYGTRAEHFTAAGLDVAGIRKSIRGFLETRGS